MSDAVARLPGIRTRVARVAAAAGGRGGALIILVALVIGFTIATPNFFTEDNLLNILRQYSVPMILAVGQTIVIVSRGIDLSVASTFSAVRGVALLITDGLPVPDFAKAEEGRTVPESVNTLGSDSLLGIPLIAVVALACVLVGGFILGRTTLGRAAYAIGGNTEAARVSGIRVERSKVWIYVISGLFAAVAGFMLTGRQGSANALMGDGMELQSIAAVVIGGTNLFGGEGKVSGTVIGILVIAVIGNGLQILGVAEFWQRVVNGLIIVAVVAIDQWRRRQARLETA